MKPLQIEANQVANLPGFHGGDARITECQTEPEFAAWSQGDSSVASTLAARFQGRVYIKTPQTLSEGGEFSLEYDCLPIEEANQRIEGWNAQPGRG